MRIGGVGADYLAVFCVYVLSGILFDVSSVGRIGGGRIRRASDLPWFCVRGVQELRRAVFMAYYSGGGDASVYHVDESDAFADWRRFKAAGEAILYTAFLRCNEFELGCGKGEGRRMECVRQDEGRGG